MMKFAPTAPIKSCGFLSLFTSRVFPQAGVPFLSSVSGVAKAEVLMGVQAGKAVGPALKLVCRATIAHAIRASLLATAHATTFE